MNQDIQLEKYSLSLDDDNYIQNTNQVIAFGIWSRYNPLSTIRQVGQISIFQSNCYHYMNAADKMSQKINFIYYDCFFEDEEIITKNVRFIDENNDDHFYSINIETDSYENVWYYFQIVQWPFIKKFELLIIKYPNIILREVLEIKYPFYDKDLLLTFGGGVNVQQIFYNKGYFREELLRYSYFPGKFILYPLDQQEYDTTLDFYYVIVDSFWSNSCSCMSNWFNNVIDLQIFTKSDLSDFQSGNTNCDYFQLAGWLKIIKLTDSNNVNQYKVIKITPDIQNLALTNDNLSPFCLYYYISDLTNSIIFTTYSYKFPSVTLDFTTNQNLITTEIEITNNIYLWHYLIVTLKDGSLYFQVTFLEKLNSYLYQSTIRVKQFNIVKLQIQIGNLEQKQDFFVLQAQTILFQNCELSSFQQGCHYSCDVCDGPTDSDCVTCQAPRIYENITQTCVCPYGTLDNSQCITLSTANLEIEKNDNQRTICEYGEFQIDLQCFTCPSIIEENQIDCLECLLNPLSWNTMMYCKNSLVSYNGETYISQTLESSQVLHFLFDGESIIYCKNCFYCLGDECLNTSFQEQQLQQLEKFCLTSGNQNCWTCNIYLCEICSLSQEQGIICKKCNINAYMENGECLISMTGALEKCIDNCSYCQGNCWACYPPFFLNTQKNKCDVCPIENCKYCFMFQTNDLSYTTLYKDFVAFSPDDNTQIGCSLCQEGYNYDFISRKCLLGSPQISNCLRSFTNLLKQEVCVLSAINDFNIAPQIINCQEHIIHCEQCLLTTTQLIKCTLCEEGYSVSISTGQCDACLIQNSYTCIEGQYYLQDYWVQLIQSFMAQFLPDNYYYPITQQQYLITQFPLSCLSGYMPTRVGACAQVCDSNCLSCQEDYFHLSFNCKACKSSYYGNPNLSVSGNTCLICPLLCLVCQPRDSSEIQLINPYFESTNSNNNYQYKCLKAIENQNIHLDSEFQIAAYCFDEDCSRNFTHSDYFDCNNIQQSLLPEFPEYYENEINIDFCNLIGVKYLTVKFTLYQINEGCITGNVIASNFLKKNIFSLQQTTLILMGDQNNILQIGLIIQNFDKVIFDNLFFSLISESMIQITNQNRSTDLFISNTMFFSRTNDLLTDTGFQIDINKNLNFTNVTLNQLYLKDLIWFEFASNLDEEVIEINQFFIYNCHFENVTLLSISQYSRVINIRNIEIYNSSFENSTFLKLGQNQVMREACFISNFYIINNTFNNSQIILNEGSYLINLKLMEVSNNYLYQSTVLSSVWNVDLQKVLIDTNKLFSSYFFKANFQTIQKSQRYFNFQLFYLKEIQLNESSLFFIHQIDQEQNILTATFSNFTHLYLTNSEETERSLIFLYDLECWEVNLRDFSIFQPWNVPYFRIYQTNRINLKNILYNSTEQPWKMSYASGCLQNTVSSPLLIHVQGFAEINFSNLSIINQFSIDYSLIHILSDILYSPSDQEIITLKDLRFFGNIILKNTLGNMLSLVVIYSDRQQVINLNNVQFEENFFNQIVDDPSQLTSSLLFINSQQSSVVINTLKCESNGLTNSSYTFITINAQSIIMENYWVVNSNFMDQSIWLKYYTIDTDIKLNNYVFNHLIQHLFTIQTQNGAGRFSSSQFVLISSFLENIIALDNSAIQITTQGQGIIEIDNLSIINSFVLLNQAIEIDGCICIHSQSSLLHLTIQNSYFESIRNRFGSAIITIYPSQKLNEIVFTNLTMYNCFSLTNQFLTAEFSKESNQQNSLQINNFNFTTTEEGWFQYLSEITFPSSLEIKKLLSVNSLIYLHDCSVELHDIYVTGIVVSPIFIMIDNPQIIITKVRLIDVRTLYPFYLVQFSQPKIVQNVFILHDVSIIRTIQLQESNKLYNQLVDIDTINSVIYECMSSEIRVSQERVNQTINYLIDLLNQNSEQQGSLIYIQGISSLSQINFNKISLIYNNCTFCYSGLMYISSTSTGSVKINDLKCYKNFIQEQGCLYLLNENVPSNLILIKDSVYLKNQGSQGVGVHSSQVLFFIKNNVFMHNNSTKQGGAIYVEKISNNFRILGTILINNYALIGGGIVLAGQNFITSTNFKDSINLFNRAQVQSNNLVETSNHLDFIINNQRMATEKLQDSGNIIYQMKLHPYNALQQGKKFITDTLLLPSDQEVSDYKFFNPQKMMQLNYITAFYLVFKNSLNEELVGSLDDECLISQRNVTREKQGIKEFSYLSNIKFDSEMNRFDLSSLIINFDPYSSSDQILQLKLQCQTNNNSMFYQFNARSFLCQLGEFYVSNGCQICQSTYGFYSVTYNTTKCSIFDKTKFSNITSNNLQILPGYWRPNRLSDATEECFKNTLWCVGGWEVGNDLCYVGHIGGLCEECDIYNSRGNGHYFKTSSKTCVICDQADIMLFPVFLVIIWTFFATLLTLKSINKTNKVFAILKAQNKLFEILFKLTQGINSIQLDFESILLKMFLNYFWIFSVIFTFNITFGFSLDIVDQANNPSFAMAVSLDCQLAQISNIQLIYLRLVAMIIFIIIQVIVISAGYKLNSICYKQPYDLAIISNTVIYLFVSNHASIIKNLSSLIASRTISEIEYIQGNVDLLFNNSDHMQWIYYLILPGLLIFGFIVPLVLFLILFLCKKRFNQSLFRKYLGYLYNEYNKQTYFWEQIKLWKRSIILLIMTYFETNINVKASLINLTLICYLLFAIDRKPYIIKSLNQLDVQSGLIVSMTLFLAQIKYISEQSYNISTSMILQVLIIILGFKLCLNYFFGIMRQYTKKYKLLVLQNLHLLFFKVKPDSFLSLYFSRELAFHRQRKIQLQMNYQKLRSCLIQISKVQLNQQKKMIQNFPSSRNSRQYLDSDHYKFIPLNRTTLS